MTVRRWRFLAVAWAVSLAVVAVVAAGQVFRSGRLGAPKMIRGQEIGFRVEAMVGERPTGWLVIRVDGK